MDSSWRYTRQLNPIDSAIYARKQSHIDNETKNLIFHQMTTRCGLILIALEILPV